MPIIQIDEFPVLGSISGTEIIHTKDPSGVDVTMTAQQVADLVPDPDVFDPTQNELTPVESDKFVLLDSSDSNNEKNATIDSIRALLGVTTATGTLATDGHWDIGAFQIRWGTILSTIDAPEIFLYSTPFSNETYTVQINLQASGQSEPITASTFSASTFTINRADKFNEPLVCDYFAIGR